MKEMKRKFKLKDNQRKWSRIIKADKANIFKYGLGTKWIISITLSQIILLSNNLAIVRTVDREIIDFYYSEIIAKIILCRPPGELPKPRITKLLYM